MYAGLNSSAKEDDPQPTVEQFLSFHSSLASSSLASTSLLKSFSSPDQSPVDPNAVDPDEAEAQKVSLQVNAERHQLAATWVNTALATDLAPFNLYTPNPKSTPKSQQNQTIMLLQSPAKSTSSSTPPPSNKPKTSTRKPGKLRGPQLPPLSPPREWARGGGTEEGAELAKLMKEESKSWFLEFVERFLDADVGERLPWDRDSVAGMLSQLKKVNDWLDDVADVDGGGGVSGETVDRIRKKIYEYLLTHVESAAVALGGGGGGGGGGSAIGGGQGRKM